MFKDRNPMVYIILVNFRGAEHTIECIESLKKITYKNYRIVVVDNASDDGSVEKLRKYSKDIILIESKENLGFSGGNNLAIDYAIQHKAEFVLLLNNDTTVEENFLGRLVNGWSEEIGICTGKILNYYDKNILWYAGGKINSIKGGTDVRGFEKDLGQYNQNEEVTFASGCCMLINKDIIEKIGKLEESYFLYFEDTEYCSRVLKAGYKIKYIPSAVIYHKESVSTVRGSRNNVYYFNRNRLFFIKDNLKLFNKILAYSYSFIFNIAKVIIGKQDIEPTIKAYKDFLCNKRGKI